MGAGLARLHASLDARDEVRSGAAHRTRAERWWRRPVWLGVTLGSAVILALTLWQIARPPQDVRFHTLAAQSDKGSSRDAVVVVFQETMTQDRMRALLHALGARIVDGPNSRGAYTLEVPPGRQQAVLQALRHEPDVRFAQPAPGSEGMRP
jgi:hypothetical protein